MKNRTTAAVLAIFAGGIGVHHFYLNQTGKGVLYLIFCWTFIPAILGVVKGISFLSMNDETFNTKYNTQPPSTRNSHVVTTNTSESPEKSLSNNSSEKVFLIKSPKNVVKLDDSGIMLQLAGRGEKKLFYKNISAVNIKYATRFEGGFIQFTLLGSRETSSMAGALGHVFSFDENTIVFSIKDNDTMLELKNLVEEKIGEASTPVSSTHQTIISEKSAAEQIKEFKELLDSGVISEEEFNDKKKQLLNI